jgi:hypothetical protein
VEPLVKLYRLEGTGYDVKGLGELKIQKNKTTGKVRILIRTEMTGRVIMNSLVTEG